MKPRKLKDAANALHRWYFVVRGDNDTLTEVRHLALGFLVCLAILYAGNTLLLAPQQKALHQKEAQLAQLLTADPGQVSQVLTTEQLALTGERQALDEENAILLLQESLLKEQWRLWGDAERFTKIIFTLQAKAPVDLENSIKQMSQLERRNRAGFAVYAVNLAGEATFQELYRYLAYIEQQPEVSVIEDLTVERLPAEGYQKPAGVRFSIVVGRLAYEEAP